MKRYVKSTSYWSPDVSTIEEVKQEIKKATDAGTTASDAIDYLDELVDAGTISKEESRELRKWVYQLFMHF